MRTARRSLLVAVIAANWSALGASHATAQTPAIGPETRWAIAPWFFPTGAEITFIDGNPNIDEALLARLAFPNCPCSRGTRIVQADHTAR